MQFSIPPPRGKSTVPFPPLFFPLIVTTTWNHDTLSRPYPFFVLRCLPPLQFSSIGFSWSSLFIFLVCEGLNLVPSVPTFCPLLFIASWPSLFPLSLFPPFAMTHVSPFSQESYAYLMHPPPFFPPSLGYRLPCIDFHLSFARVHTVDLPLHLPFFFPQRSSATRHPAIWARRIMMFIFFPDRTMIGNSFLLHPSFSPI